MAKQHDDTDCCLHERVERIHRDSLNGLKDLILGEIEKWAEEWKVTPERGLYMPIGSCDHYGYNKALEDLASFIKSIS